MDDAKDIDVVVPVCDLIEYNNNYLKTSGSLWQYYRDGPNATWTGSESFKFKLKITGSTSNEANTKDRKIAVPLKYLSNFQRTLEMLLINYEMNLILTCSENCFFFCNWINRIWNKRYRTLCSGCNFVNST